MAAKKPSSKIRRLFVLDTNVLLHDPYCLFRFAEHDIFVPFVTLEELDNKKAGSADVNRNARQATRLIEEVVSQEGDMSSGYALKTVSGTARGRLFVQQHGLPFLENEHLRKNDNLYLSVLHHLSKDARWDEVRMVSKDINLRIKARAMGFIAEDYRHDHAIEDADLIYKGLREVAEETFYAQPDLRSWTDEGIHYVEVSATDYIPNEFIRLLPSGSLLRVLEVAKDEGITLFEHVEDYSKPRNAVLGVCARTTEQSAAFSLLLDPEVDLVALLGPAGTGKTLLALSSALEQVEAGRYESILFTRAATPLGEDIGFLPGSEEEKMTPWLGAMFDNIEYLATSIEERDGIGAAHKFKQFAKENIDIRAMTFMRGRTFHRRFVIIDEAQNLTPAQVKALITRAGEGAKIVVLGNLAQIDSPYLTETSSGLAYLVERFKGWAHFGSLVLGSGERSRLASEANSRL